MIGNIDTTDLSPWQLGRIRSRLISYYFIQKNWYASTKRAIKSTSEGRDRQLELDQQGLLADDYSWKQMARDIVFSDATDLATKIDEEKYYREDDEEKRDREDTDIHKDYGLPLRGDNLNKLFRGELKPAKIGGRVRVFPTPDEFPAIIKFLMHKQYLSENDLAEPVNWPRIEELFPDIDLFPPSSYPPELPFALARDFLEQRKSFANGPLLSLSTKRSDEPMRARLVTPRSQSPQNPRTGYSPTQLPRNKWLWGWQIILTAEQAILRFCALDDLEESEAVTSWVMIGHDGVMGRSPRLDEVMYSPSEFPIKEHAILKYIGQHSSVAIENRINILSLKTINEQYLTKAINSFNIIASSARKPKYRLSRGEAKQDDKPPTERSPELEEFFSRRSEIRRGEEVSAMENENERTKEEKVKRARDFFESIAPRPHPNYDVDPAELADPVEISKYYFWCICEGFAPNAEEVDRLVKLGMDVNYCDKGTALHVIAYAGTSEHLRPLIKQPGLNYLIKDYQGRLPSEIAAQYSAEPSIIRFLIKKEMEQARASTPPIDYEKYLLGDYKCPEDYAPAP